jgi:hypothetical protein
MKNGNVILIGILSLFVLACGSEESKEFSVKDLDTIEKRIVFLDSILVIDQKVRIDATEAQQQFGYESKEHNFARERMEEVDSLNLEVIHEYLKTFDYPSEEDYGRDANRALWMVIHHAPSGYGRDYRDENMPYLLKAWKRGNLKDSDFSFFLNRMYRKRFGESFTFEGSMKVTNEIDTLLVLMNYKKIKL